MITLVKRKIVRDRNFGFGFHFRYFFHFMLCISASEQGADSHYEVPFTSWRPRREQVGFPKIVSWVWWTCVVTPGLHLGCLQWLATVLDAHHLSLSTLRDSTNDESGEPYQKYPRRACHIRPSSLARPRTFENVNTAWQPANEVSGRAIGLVLAASIEGLETTRSSKG